MACPQQRNVETKQLKKLTKYRHLAFEMQERRPGYEILIIPIVIGALGGGMKQAILDLGKIFSNEELTKKTIYEMQKTVLMDSETTI